MPASRAGLVARAPRCEGGEETLSTAAGPTILTWMDFFPVLLKAILLALVVAFTLFAVSILAVLVVAKLRQKRALKALARSPCPSCGQPFGRAAAIAAHERFVAERQEMRRQNPNIKFSLMEVWTVCCPHCCATAEFVPTPQKLTSASP